MGNMAKGTRVKYIGPHNRLTGLEGNISELERPNAMGATVLWDNGIEYFNYWCELSILADAKPAAEASEPDPVNQPQDGVKYLREIKPGVFVDVYDVLRAFAVVNPALQHLIKKALAVGQRGHKDAAEDLQNIYESAKRAIELEQDNA